MMEKKDILENGLLERYVLGELNREERSQLEETLDGDSELRARLEEIEVDLEKVAFENAVNPPEVVKQRLMRQLQEDEDVIVKPLRKGRDASRFFLGVAATLAVLLLLSSFWLFQKANGLENELELVKQQNEKLNENYNSTLAELNNKTDWYEYVNDPGTDKLLLKGNDLSPDTKAVTFINHERKSVFLSTEGLAELSEDKDYQLWADVEGEMIDMGVVPRNQELAMMSYIDDAESLNITIEPKGGSDHPTVSQLITNVYLEP